ncbi:tetraspanin-7-like isoform X2 [Toxotes jaculatrix]|nr:tetraspanin-7-like isoform X2 [Toxotes jaculatrix]
MSEFGGPSLGWAWLFVICSLGISCLGIYAGCSEKILALKIFAGFMATGLIITMIFGIVMVVARNQIRDALQNSDSEAVKPFMEDNEMRKALEHLQSTVGCCGLVSASDWGRRIPDSCDCQSHGSQSILTFISPGRCIPSPQGTTGPSKVYEETCGGYIYMVIDIIFKIAMAFFFGCAVLALLGLMVSLLMICQVKRHDSAGEPNIAMKSY